MPRQTWLAGLVMMQQALSYTFTSYEDLHGAVTAYCANVANAEATYGAIAGWNFTGFASFENLFAEDSVPGLVGRCHNFNGDIGGWDVSMIGNMRGVFKGARSFNQPLVKWDVSLVNSMYMMFEGATAFDQLMCATSPGRGAASALLPARRHRYRYRSAQALSGAPRTSHTHALAH